MVCDKETRLDNDLPLPSIFDESTILYLNKMEEGGIVIQRKASEGARIIGRFSPQLLKISCLSGNFQGRVVLFCAERYPYSVL